MGTNLAPIAKAIGGPNMNPLASIPVIKLHAPYHIQVKN